jgi:hypothetical protein
LRHYLSTELYFRVNPVQLSVAVVYLLLVQHLKLVSESDFVSFLTGLGVQFNIFKDKVLNLMQLERYSQDFFSKEKIEGVLKKFQLLTSKLTKMLIYRNLQIGSVQEEDQPPFAFRFSAFAQKN